MQCNRLNVFFNLVFDKSCLSIGTLYLTDGINSKCSVSLCPRVCGIFIEETTGFITLNFLLFLHAMSLWCEGLSEREKTVTTSIKSQSL